MKKSYIFIFFVCIVSLSFFSCTEEGYTHNNPLSQIIALKEVDFDSVEGAKHFTTQDSVQASNWFSKELGAGRLVESEFDKQTKEYRMVSIPRGGVPIPESSDIGKLLEGGNDLYIGDTILESESVLK